jgi:hypothetical protein
VSAVISASDLDGHTLGPIGVVAYPCKGALPLQANQPKV